MYGYTRLTILLNKKFQFGVGTGLIYKLMSELDIQSRTIKKWVYLASIYNTETRRVLSHKIEENMTKELATSVIDPKVLKKLGTTIIHSDMGSQYTSDLFESTLSKHKIKHSYSKKGALEIMLELRVFIPF